MNNLPKPMLAGVRNCLLCEFMSIRTTTPSRVKEQRIGIQ